MPYSKEYLELHREEINKKNRERYQRNKDKYNQNRNKNYKYDKDTYKKSILRTWKDANIIIFENTFEKYYNAKKCEFCNVEFSTIGGKTLKNKRVLDHDHLTNYARFIICHSCNIKNRKLDSIRMKLNLEIYRYHNNK